jgi:3-phosphoshikimate 1-carboxyvinyltransferase
VKSADLLEIQPLPRPPFVPVPVPGSTCITVRALLLAALAQGRHRLHNAAFGADTEAIVDALRRLGFVVMTNHARRLIEVHGRGGAIPATHADLFVGTAATAARLLLMFVCLGHGRYRLHGLPRLHDRRMDDAFGLLAEIGVRVESHNGRFPAVVHANGLRAGRFTLAERTSPESASALLLVAGRAGMDIVLATADEPFGQIALTRELVGQWAGSAPDDYLIEPDLVCASHLIAAGFITGGKVSVLDWPASSLQVDSRFPQFLPTPLRVSRHSDLGDSALALTICALFGRHPMTLVGTGRLRTADCDRVRVVAAELRKCGARVEEAADSLTVWPAETGQLRGADIETQHDPHVAMLFTVLGLKVPGIRLRHAACVRTVFPEFFERLEWLRRVVIAIDGTSGSGKSTLARRLARHYGFVHVDTGAMYRTLTWVCLERGVSCNDPDAVVRVMQEMRTEFQVRDGRAMMFANNLEPGESIRADAVNQNVSLVARIPEVRAWMVARQRELLRFGSLVMEGRDIGSVVFADTPYKFYLDAHPEARAERRARDGYTDQVAQRDKLDTTRRVSPLTIAPGALIMDTSQNTPDQTEALALAELSRRGL